MPLEVEGVLDENRYGEPSQAWRRVLMESARIAGLKIFYRSVNIGSDGVQWIQSARADFPMCHSLPCRSIGEESALPPIVNKLYNPSTSLATLYTDRVNSSSIRMLSKHMVNYGIWHSTTLTMAAGE